MYIYFTKTTCHWWCVYIYLSSFDHLNKRQKTKSSKYANTIKCTPSWLTNSFFVFLNLIQPYKILPRYGSARVPFFFTALFLLLLQVYPLTADQWKALSTENNMHTKHKFEKICLSGEMFFLILHVICMGMNPYIYNVTLNMNQTFLFNSLVPI